MPALQGSTWLQGMCQVPQQCQDNSANVRSSNPSIAALSVRCDILLTGPSSASSAGGGDQVSAMGRLLEGGLIRLADSDAPADAAAAARLLPRVVHLMVPLVSGYGFCSTACSCAQCFL